MLADVRYALRLLAAAPGFASAAVLSLAIGIGANTAIFSVTSALLLRPLPYADADRLVILWNRSPGLNIAEDWFSTAQYFDIKTTHRGFEQLAIAIGANYNLTGTGDPDRIGVIRVSSNLLPMLGAKPALGRLFQPSEDAPGQAESAVLSDGTWRRRFGADPHVVGRAILLNGLRYEIVGVLPASFSLPREVLPTLGVAEDGEVFLPLPLAADAASVRIREDYNVIGKLARGVSVAQAQAEMEVLTARLRRDFPAIYPPAGGLTFGIVPLQEQVVGGVRRALIVLLASVAGVLLIACANVANLLLARALARRREVAVRTALGATRARLIRQLLTESLLLALAGGVLGTALAAAGVRWLQALQPAGVPRLGAIAINGGVLLFTLLLSVVSGVLFGLAPALGARRVDVHGTLKDSRRGSAGSGAVWGRGNNARRVLVAAELALAVILLVGAGLLVRSFAGLQRVDPGFEPRGVLTFELTMTGPKYGDAQTVRNSYRALWERLDRIPGLTASGGVSALPLSGFFSWGPITVEGFVPPGGDDFINADQRVVGGRYFEAMGIPLRRGRWFAETDTLEAPRVIVIDEFMAQQFWPGQDPVGRRVKLAGRAANAPWRTIVGVVGRVKQYGLDSDGRIALYIPQTQTGSRASYVVVRTSGDPAGLLSTVSSEIHAMDPLLPVYRSRPMTQRVDESLARQRFAMVMVGLFAGLALTLAAIGVYGVIAYLVHQGTREMGIRVALGASPRAILGLVLRQGLMVSLTGVTIGLAGAWALTRLMRSLLFNVDAADPLTFTAMAAGLLVTALAATFLPARRAARIDPAVSLRET